MKVYLAGPLFTPYERAHIDQCAAKMRAAGLTVFVPHEQPFPPGEISGVTIFRKDAEGLLPAEAMVAILDGPVIDDGTACEIGLFCGLKAGDASKRGVVGLISDSRILGASGRAIDRKGLNRYVEGCIEDNGAICDSIDDAITALLEWQRAGQPG